MVYICVCLGAGRGIALVDIDQNGWLDLIYTNYESENRMFLRDFFYGANKFSDYIATASASDEGMESFKEPGPVRTLLVADFDNDGQLELFFNMMVDEPSKEYPNRLIRVSLVETTMQQLQKGPAPKCKIEMKEEILKPGPAEEPHLHGTGGAFADMNGDGYLEVLLTHGEDAVSLKPMHMYIHTHIHTFGCNEIGMDTNRVQSLSQFE